MEPIHWAILLSFIIGACGYVVVKLWIIPIAGYRQTKGRLKDVMKKYEQKLPDDSAASAKQSPGKKGLKEMRRLGMKLVGIHDVDLPYWYRLMLLTRKESAQAATEAMLKLENLQTVEQVRQCLVEVGKHLGFQK